MKYYLNSEIFLSMRIQYCFVFLAVFLVFQSVQAQDVFSPFYVVIGAFKSEENAQKYCTYAHEQNLPAVYAHNQERGMYYVYVRATQTKDVADDILIRLRNNTVFRDAWVFNGVLSGSNLAKRSAPPLVTKPVQEAEPQVATPEPEEKEFVDTPSGAVPEPTQPVVETPVPVGKPFVFKLVNAETGDVLNGLVRLQESDKARQFRGYNGNEKVYVPAPANRTGKWVVRCQVLGFQPLKKSIVYAKAHELSGASVGAGDEIIIPLELERVRRGDYIEMEGVKFYNNTALFAPGSERELEELVAMMVENPDYHIRLHGHTNGDDARDIVSLGRSADFFAPDVANAKTHGSAKELSLMRAELVKAYLVSKDIDVSRITTKGEGGKQMIFDPRGTLAGMNDRVEVEIKKH